MANVNTGANAGLIRHEIFKDELQENFNTENFMQNLIVNWMDDVEGDSSQINIPGYDNDIPLDDWTEGGTINAYGLTDRVFKFTLDQAKASAIEITKEMLRSSYYISKVLPMIPTDQTRKCYEVIEEYIFALSQILPVQVDGKNHRLQASGTSGKLAIADLGKAKYRIMETAKIKSGFVAFINEAQAFEIEQSIGIVSPANAEWEHVASQGLMDATGMRVVGNIYGIMVYVSEFLPKGVDNTGNGGVDASAKDSVLVLSVSNPRKLPFIAGWVERPNFDYEYVNMERKERHIVHMSFGGGLLYPQNLVVIECEPSTID